MEDTRFACSLTLSQCADQICYYYKATDWNGYSIIFSNNHEFYQKNFKTGC